MLFPIFVIVTLAEIYVLVSVGQAIGGLSTVLLVIITAFIGSSLLRQQGWSTLAKAQQSMAEGRTPAMEMLEGVVFLVSGILLLTPGFLTDGLGLLGLLPWSPLGAGVLAGALQKTETGRRASEFVRTRVERFADRLEPYEALCRELEVHPAQVATAWLLHNPVVTAPIIGPRTMEQLEAALQAVELKLEDEVLAKLDAIFPGPGGEAPEAYAW